MPGPHAEVRRFLRTAGFGAAAAAAVSVLPPGRPLEADVFVLLLLAGLATKVAAVLEDDRESWQLPLVTGVLLLAALTSAAVHVLHHRLAHPRIFVALVLLGTAGMVPTLRRLPRRVSEPSTIAPRTAVIGGRWALLRPLPGADPGGFSDPWLGADPNRGGRLVVVKLETRLPERRDESRHRLERERRVLAMIQSRWVVQFHDGGLDGPSDRRYVVVDYHPVGSLAKHLDNARELQLSWIIGIVTGVLRGLVVLHSELPQPMAHRDLTPRNVLLRRDGRTPVLCDFGSARLLTRHGPDWNDRVTGGAVYSRYYAAPELVDQGLRDRLGPTSASDLYAAGSILYELLTGRPPYWREEQETGLDFARLVLNPDLHPVPPTWVNPELPSAADALLAWVLALDPDDRPASAERLLAELQTLDWPDGNLRIPFDELRHARIPAALGATTTRRER